MKCELLLLQDMHFVLFVFLQIANGSYLGEPDDRKADIRLSSFTCPSML